MNEYNSRDMVREVEAVSHVPILESSFESHSSVEITASYIISYLFIDFHHSEENHPAVQYVPLLDRALRTDDPPHILGDREVVLPEGLLEGTVSICGRIQLRLLPHRYAVLAVGVRTLAASV